MPDFLGRLAARSLGVAPVAQPIVPTMFAPGDPSERHGPADENAIAHEAVERVHATAATNFELEPRTGNASAPEGEDAPPDLYPKRLPAEAAPMRAETDIFTVAAPEVTRNVGPESKFSIVPGKDRVAAIANGKSQPATMTAQPATIAAKNFSVVPENLQQQTPAEPPVRPAALAGLGRESTLPVPLPSSSRNGFAGVGSRSPVADAPAPVIRVTIGRVDVRAEFPTSPTRASARPSSSGALSLEEYARQRREGKR